ncbi:MAG: nucleoside hydrolase [Chloroflexi bacterium]|nr:nucleoside hydrolase [Chloroflexota bacterium]
MSIDIILDTDIATDVDDCLALALILSSPELSLRGITCVYGDVDLRARFTAKLLALHGSTDIPVTAGARLPLLNKRPVYWEGREGEGLLTDDDAEIAYSGENAVDFIVRTAFEKPGQIHLVGIAPLTNIALALIREPKLPLKHITLMGGVARSIDRLDLPFAEHNIQCDPEAAHIVFSSGIPTTLVPLDLTTQVRLRAEGVAKLRALGSPYHEAVARQVELYPRFQHLGYTFVHDPLAVAAVIDPTFIRTERVRIDVELAGQHSAGMTLMKRDPSGHVDVGVAVDIDRFETWLVERLCG